jgi:hypothetical protein
MVGRKNILIAEYQLAQSRVRFDAGIVLQVYREVWTTPSGMIDSLPDVTAIVELNNRSFRI